MTMPPTKAELKARLLAQVEAAIDELLVQKKAPEIASLADIEQVALQAGQRLEEAITTELLEAGGQALTASWPTCPTCGKRLLAKGKRPRRVVTETGEAEITRDYYYCRYCRKGIFPPG
jgi:hypothetical protein